VAERVLLVSGEYPPDVGGLADYTACLRAALSERGLDVDVLTRRRRSGGPAHACVKRVVTRWNARALGELVHRAPRGGIVHIQYQAAAFDLLGDICLAPLLLRARARVLTTFHDARVPYLFPKAGRLRLKVLQLMARASDAVLASTAEDLQAVRARPARSHVVPIGSNVACDPPPGYERDTFRAQLGLGPGDLGVAYFGLLNASKGLHTLVETFERVLQVEPTARLLLLGGAVGASDATDRRTADQTLREVERFGHRVVRTGHLQPRDLSAHLLAADVALLPYADGASLRRGSLLACAAHGLPIVSTAPTSGGLDQVVLATPAADAEALASAVIRVGHEPELRARLRRASAQLAERSAWYHIADQHVRIYRALSGR
jgi:glycosyltransferase involved in cell wall biosynthesis